MNTVLPLTAGLALLAGIGADGFSDFAAGALGLLQGFTLYRVTKLGDQVAELRGRCRQCHPGQEESGEDE